MLNLKNKRVFNLIVYNHNEYSSRLILPQAPFEELFSLKEIENARKNIFALSARYRNISRISKQKKNETFLRGKWLHPPGPIKNTNGKTEDEKEISRLFSQRSVKNKQKLAKVEKNKKETNSLEGNCYSFT
jgi:hypothetical protein